VGFLHYTPLAIAFYLRHTGYRTAGKSKKQEAMLMIAKGPMRLKAEARTKQNYPIIQSLKKNGEWGVARATPRYGKETDEQVLARLHELNPGIKFRIVG
jgi:hypothetical protein